MDGDMNLEARLVSYIQQGNNEQAKSILEDLNPNDLTDGSSMLLHIASRVGNEDMTRYLIERGCNVNIADSQKNTPLILAAKSRNTFIMHMLLESHANNVLMTNEDGESAAKIIIYDLRCCEVSVLTLLLKKVKEECSNDSLATAKKLLELRCLICQAVCLRDTIVTRYLLKSGLRVNKKCVQARGLNALHQAIRSTDLENVKVLMEFGADINAETYHQLRKRPVNFIDWHDTRSIEILKYLLESGCQLMNKNGRVFIGDLFHYGNKQTIELLLQYLPDLNVRNRSGTPLLQSLAGNEKFDPVDILIGKNLDINAQDDSDGTTALMEAVYYNNIRTVQFLLLNDADVNIVDKLEKTALMKLFYNRSSFNSNSKLNTRLKCINLLLQHGVDVQWISSNPKTIFDLAIMMKEFLLIKPVLAHLAVKEAVGGQIKDLIMLKINSHSMFKNYFNFCKRTVEKMKRTTIYGSITLFKFFIVSEKNISIFARNGRLVSKLKLMRFFKRRSKLYYHIVLRSRIKKIIQVADLRNKALDVLFRIQEIRSNRIIAEKIVDYFNYHDLQIIAQV